MRGIAWLGAVVCLMLLAGCGEPPPAEPRGYVSGLSSDKVRAGEQVVVRGQGFGTSGTIMMAGGKTLTASLWDHNTISIKIPEDQAPGPTTLEIRTTEGSLGSANLTILAALPRVKEVAPEVASVGDVVTVTGSGFGEGSKGTALVYGAKAEIKEWKDGKIVIVVPELPADPPSFSVWIENEGGKSNEKDFAVLKPYASVMVPDPAMSGRTVTLKGRDFGTTKGKVLVGIKKIPAEVVEWTPNAIRVVVPEAITGQVEIRVVNQNGASIPVLVSILPRPDLGRIGKAPGDQVSLALDDVDLPYICTFDTKKNALASTVWTANGWSTQQTVVTLGKATGTFPKVAPDLEKKLSAVIATYEGKKGDPKANQAAMKKELDLITAEAQKEAASIHIDALVAGMNPHVSIDKSRRLRLTMWEASKQQVVLGEKGLDEVDWAFEFVDRTLSGKMGLANDVAVDPRGVVHVGYMDAKTRQVRHAMRVDGKFVTEAVDPEQDQGASIAIGVSPKGNAALAWLDFGKFDLKAAVSDGKAFKVSRVDEKGWTGDMPSLSFDDNGAPVIAFMQRTDDGKAAAAVKIAALVGSQWNIETVDAGPGVGNQPILRKDTKGRFHLVYMDGRDSSIKYLVRKGIAGPWEKQSVHVDDLRNELLPGIMSMAIASDDTARLVYFTNTGFMEFRQLTPK